MTLTREDLSAISQLLDEGFGKIDERMDRMENRMDRMDERMDRMENRMDKLESNVSALRAGQIEIRKDINRMDMRMDEIFGNVLDNWGAIRELEVRVGILEQERKAG